ncbi:hypothetical protein [Streptacidiphilus sp. PAMC 29251]
MPSPARLTASDRDQHLAPYSTPPGSTGAEAPALPNVLGAGGVAAY